MDSSKKPTFIKLISEDGHEFVLEKSMAVDASVTIRTILEGSFKEAQENVIRFPDISSFVLERVVRYMHYKAYYSRSNGRIPEFPIEPEAALELLVACKYLQC